MYFLITIDTEGDNQWSKASRKNITTQNARYLPRFQSLCEEYGFKPTYLTSYEMAKDVFFVDFAKSCLRKGTCEIGAHPHAWNCPPEYNLTGDDPCHGTYIMEYPKEVIVSKLKYLKKFLEETFEIQVVSHRSGRWAFNEDHAKALDSLQFKVDCSVTPHISWVKQFGDPNGHGGTDYTGFPSQSYYVDLDDISKPGKSHLLEIPMTVRKSFLPSLTCFCGYLKQGRIRTLGRSLFYGHTTWFRPGKTNVMEILHLIKKQSDAGSDHLMFMLHSSEFMPGGNPVFVSPGDIEQLFVDMHTIFESLRQINVKPVTCSQYYDVFRNNIQRSGM
jgi:hypothetical protein